MTSSDASLSNRWKYWRPIYRFTWALAQSSSYRDFNAHLRGEAKKVLDIGSGTGEYIKSLRTDCQFYFSDIEAASLAKAKSRAQRYLRPGSFHFLQADAHEAIKQVPSVDVISLLHVISVIPEPQKLIEEAYDKLSPGGELLIYISRMSKRFADVEGVMFRQLGFDTVDLMSMRSDWEIKKVGALNERYRLVKPY